MVLTVGRAEVISRVKREQLRILSTAKISIKTGLIAEDG